MLKTERWRSAGIGVPALALVVALAGSAYLALQPATDPDYGWHVANGRNLWNGILLGGHDVYSWTAAGHAWVAHEWLTDVAMAFLNDAFGPVGTSLAAAAVVVLAMGLVAVRLRGRNLLAVALTLAIVCRAAYVSFGVRPQLLELLYLSAWLLALDAWLARRLATRRLFVSAVGLMLLWANSHGSFLLAPVVAAVLAAALGLAGDRRAITAASLAVLVAAVPLVNPWGPALYGFATQSLSSGVTGRLIQEWQPPDLLGADFAAFAQELAFLLVGALLAVGRVVRTLRAGGGVSPSSRDAGGSRWSRVGHPLLAQVRCTWTIALTALMIALALRSGRFVMLVGITAAPILAWTLEQVVAWAAAVGEQARRLVEQLLGRGTAGKAPERGRLNLVLATAAAVGLCVAGLARISPAAQEQALSGRYPVSLLPALDEAVTSAGGAGQARLLNAYDDGGFLLEWRPHLPVFIDGRSEVYGDALLAEAATLFDAGPGWRTRLDRLRPRVALLDPGTPLVPALEQAGWTVRGSDGAGVLLVAPTGSSG